MPTYKLTYDIFKEVEHKNDSYTLGKLTSGDHIFHNDEYNRDAVAQVIRNQFGQFVPLPLDEIEVCVLGDGRFSVNLWEDMNGNYDAMEQTYFATYELCAVVSTIPDEDMLDRLNIATAKGFYN